MDDMLKAIEANNVVMDKHLLGEIPTVEEYANALNLNNQVLNGTQSSDMGAMIILLVATMSAAAEIDGYTVNYDKESDAFSVTKGTN